MIDGTKAKIVVLDFAKLRLIQDTPKESLFYHQPKIIFRLNGNFSHPKHLQMRKI